MKMKSMIPTYSLFLCLGFYSCAQLQTSVSSDETRKKLVTYEKQYPQFSSEDMNLKIEEALSEKGSKRDFLADELFLKGNDASIHGDFRSAATFYSHFLKLRPHHAMVEKKLAIELIRLGELKEARGVLSSLYQRDKKDDSAGLILAGVLTALEANDEARNLYKTILATKDSEEACLYLAKFYAGEKKFEKAHQLLSQCEKRMKDEPTFSFYRGKIEYEQGHFKQARNFYEKSLKIDKSFAQGVLALGGLYEEKEEAKKALELYVKFLNTEGNSNSVSVLSKVVNLMLTIKEGDKEVEPYLQTLISLEPNDLNLKVKLGLYYSENTRYKEAQKVLKEVLDVVPDSDKVLYYLGALSQQLTQFEDAITYYLKILPSSPLYGEASNQVGQIFSLWAKEDFSKGKTDGVKRFQSFILDRLKDHEENRVDLKMLEANFYDETEQYQKAIADLNELKDHKNFSDTHRYYLASLYEKIGEFKMARDMVQKILEKDPNNAHALNFLGYSFLEKKEELDRAYKYISKAVKLKPEDGYIRDSLAWYYFTVGKFHEALKESKKAVELSGADAIITKHLATIYYELKNFDKAKETYAEALKNSKLPSERNEISKMLEEIDHVRLPASVSKGH